ncbi:hypothetical protein [Laspinema olomoucense]|uniref:Uncharacterized protein n=1 Tax=Laspinema olomoucense D3b TaxID=2953688 RepID=A0ABT2N1W3_9CYAN|nr:MULTISPECIES: hypothetical protein [unclassified Laspinema]MCT7972830.1 hypothetical protein [Laspinema sp. D3d]MCT7976672.1 hypothetical protein [Laspinema sp. D3b]MCT7991748.1 hypothetical protein [Laspinema sp. D3a]MCT7995632.1 hypothetical protein [Laspinema sp. D3c]
MKKSSFLNSLSIAALFSIAPLTTDLAAAQCVQIDTGVQISISGGGPAQQTNTVDMGNQNSCGRNATVTTGTQIHVGPNRAVQNRSVRQSVQGGERSLRPSSYPVQIQVNPKIHVDNPADRLNSINNPALRYREQLRLIE